MFKASDGTTACLSEARLPCADPPRRVQEAARPGVANTMTVRALDAWVDAMARASYEEQRRVHAAATRGKKGGGPGGVAPAASLASLCEKIAQFLASFYFQARAHGTAHDQLCLSHTYTPFDETKSSSAVACCGRCDAAHCTSCICSSSLTTL
jgi:hypothetical protein